MLTPLYDLTQQFQNKNGSILVAGKLFVYYIGRPDLATTWADDGASAVNPNPILLDNNGRAPCFVDDGYSYTLVVCDRNGQELFSQDITPGGAGSVGGRVVYHDETLTGAGTVASLLGVVNIPLGVDDTMTAYTGVVDNKDALILGVNGDWFTDTFGSALNDKVDWSSFSACCSAVKGGLDNKVDLSALDNYYTKYEVNSALSNKVDVNYFIDYTSAMEDRLEHSLVFGYDENSAISSINYSALAGGGDGDYTPWISGAKILADTQTLTDNMIVQVLSSFTLSGNKNHCIAVKGGTYRFPNKWEIASGIAETNYFMPQSSMSGYLPISSFSGYTASVASNLENNWNYTNSAYGLSINNFYNKLDASAFSAYTADAGETYTLVGGDNISISSDDEEKTTTISVTGEVGDTTPWISGAKILAEAKYMEPGGYIQALSSFTLSGNKNHCIAVKGGGYYFPTNYMLASGISSNLTGVLVPTSTFGSFISNWANQLITLYGNDSYLSSCVSNISANKLDASSYHELTAGTNIDIQNYVISGKDWTTEIREASANAFNEATAANPTSSTQWNSCYETVNTNSGDWNKVSGKLDSTAFEAYTADDETYLLKGGYNIGVSSDDVNKETTIYYTGTNGDEQVNQVVRQYSAAGTWLTSHQDWTNTITAASAYAYSQATAQIPAPFDPTYISGQIDNKLNKSESANYYPMTGNPSGFIITETDWTNTIREASSYAYNQATAHEPDMSLYVPMSAVSALIDVVQTYSGKWLLNGDL